MDNPQLFSNFTRQILHVNVDRAQDMLVSMIPTFRALMRMSEVDLDSFMKDVHGANSAKPAGQRIFYNPATIANLKAIRFDLQDRASCNALPDAAMINAIDAAQLEILRANRSESNSKDDVSNLPDINIPKFTISNYEDFMEKFEALVSRTKGNHGVSIDYLLRTDEQGDYDAVWTDRNDKLRHCLSFTGTKSKEDSKILYQMYLNAIGTNGNGSNLVIKHQQNKNGRLLHIDFKTHFANSTFLQNKATAASNQLRTLHYKGDRTRFKIEDYYTRITQCFNDLAAGGAQFALNEDQKVQQFQSGIEGSVAAQFHVNAKKEWHGFPVATRTFDSYYNLFSARLAEYRTMTSNNDSSTSNFQVRAVDTGRGRGRGRGRGNRSSGNRGRGRGRGRNSYHPYQQHGIQAFTREARSYDQSMYSFMSREQRNKVQRLKVEAGWKDGRTPSDGFILNHDGYAIPSPSVVAAINATHASLPPRPTTQPPLPPPVREITTNNAGAAFGPGSVSGSRKSTDVHSTISNINSRQSHGHVYDAQGNRIS